MADLTMPSNLAEAARREARLDWLHTLPAIVRDLGERWSLRVGEPYEPGGQTAWVAPAHDRLGADRVLKIGWRHPESFHEAAGLRAWNGYGAVQVYEVAEFDDTIALLLEQCTPGTTLRTLPEAEQDVVIAALFDRLWLPPSPDHVFRPLQQMCDQWADEFEHHTTARASVDPGLAREGIALFRSLPATATREVLLCTDLHAGNVLAAEREPWLMIDPKPYVGDPTYDALQHMLNCDQRLRADPRGFAQHMADLLELDPVRLELWLFARCVQESPHWWFSGLADVARKLAPA